MVRLNTRTSGHWSCAKLLRIDRSSGIIYVKGPLDREEINNLMFYVVARDKGPSPKSSKTYVSIDVTDQNDNAQQWRFEALVLLPIVME